MENEKRLIDANARIEEIKKANCTNCDSYNGIKCRACWVDDAIGLIDDATTVDAVEVVHGRWIPGEFEGEYTCSRCGMEYCEADPTERPYKYCPECGSKNE